LVDLIAEAMLLIRELEAGDEVEDGFDNSVVLIDTFLGEVDRHLELSHIVRYGLFGTSQVGGQVLGNEIAVNGIPTLVFNKVYEVSEVQFLDLAAVVGQTPEYFQLMNVLHRNHLDEMTAVLGVVARGGLQKVR